jgi:hypothetical protein
MSELSFDANQARRERIDKFTQLAALLGRALIHDLARVVDAMYRKNKLGEIDANGQNSH